MTWATVIRSGHHDNITLASVQYDQHGTRLSTPVIMCDTWVEGFQQARSQGFTSALFVDSGTMIPDWVGWQQLINQYPHQGLIAHIMWPPGQDPWLDTQCWFMDLDKFDQNDFDLGEHWYPGPNRSNTNLHDDYTPLWISPGSGTAIRHSGHRFGQGLIARQMQQGRTVVNWNQTARGKKSFIYHNQTNDTREIFSDYISMAEQQLWVLNNEPIASSSVGYVMSPASGLYWIMHVCQDTPRVHLIDISRSQLDLARHLWQHWDGDDYGGFVWDFIKQNNLAHYELDQANLDPLERLRLKNPSRFISYVNDKFNQCCSEFGIENFPQQWQAAQQCHWVEFTQGSMIAWVLEHGVGDVDHVWSSNIDQYRWTLLHHSSEEIKKFKELVYEK